MVNLRRNPRYPKRAGNEIEVSKGGEGVGGKGPSLVQSGLHWQVMFSSFVGSKERENVMADIFERMLKSYDRFPRWLCSFLSDEFIELNSS